jgi:hypothetical protein
MNSTQILSASQFTTSEYANFGLGGLLLISEMLPMLKKHKGNGLVDTLLCIIRGSSCFLEKLTETLEKTKETEEKELENV